MTHRQSKYKDANIDEKLHVYEVDPMVVEFGPGQVESFRDKKTYQTSIGRESFRTSIADETPKKGLLKQ